MSKEKQIKGILGELVETTQLNPYITEEEAIATAYNALVSVMASAHNNGNL